MPGEVDVPGEVGVRQRIGGHVVAEQMVELGADLAFGVPGESYLPVLDGLYEFRDRIRLITTRQEGGASMMAAAYGKLTGRPGICLVTRGPGATNASIGVHVAHQDASPMVLFVGQIPRRHLGRRAFQEVDYRAMFSALAKDVIQIESADRIPELVARAFHVAVSGEPGPVVVAMPEDVLNDTTGVEVVRDSPKVRSFPSGDQVMEFSRLVNAARRPLIVVGGSGWTTGAARALRRFAERSGIPVATAVRQQDLIDNTSEVYAGTLGMDTTPGLAAKVAEADLLALVGPRPDAVTLDHFELLPVPSPAQTLIHVHPDPDVIHRVYRADLAIVSGPAEFAESLAASTESFAASGGSLAASAGSLAASADESTRSRWLRTLRDGYVAGMESGTRTGTDSAPFMKEFNDRMPAGTIMTCGAGAYTAWLQKNHQYITYPSQLATHSGAMGFGLPAAIAASLTCPDRPVVAFAGDGCLLMTGQELATVAQYGLRIIVVVINNSSYGIIRNHQEAQFPGRVVGTDLTNPDFVGFARSFGLQAERVETPDDFGHALDRAMGGEGASVIEIIRPL